MIKHYFLRLIKPGYWLPIFVSLAVVMQVGPAHAQVALRVNHYTSENGLPQNSIKSIAADKEGYVWLATEAGLVRFDGRNFVSLSGKLNTSVDGIVGIQPVYQNNGILANGRASKMYAETNAGDLIQIKDGNAEKDDNAYNYKQALTSAQLQSMKGVNWIKGIPNISGFPDDERPHGLPAASRDGNYYVFNKNSVIYYRGWKKNYEISVNNLVVSKAFVWDGNLCWVKDRNTVSQVVNGRVQDLRIIGDIINDPSYNDLTAEMKLLWNPNSEQAFLHQDNATYVLERYGNGMVYARLLAKDFDFHANGITVAYYDAINGKLLAGGLAKGLFVIHVPQFEVVKTGGNEISNVFYAQVAFGENTVLTPTGNILGKDARSGQIIDQNFSMLAELNPADKWVIFRSKDGKLWIRSWEKLLLFSKGAETLEKTWEFEKHISSVCQDKSGKIWVGVSKDIFLLDPKQPEIAPKQLKFKLPANITCMETARDGSLLVGTEAGLYKVGTTSGSGTILPGTDSTNIKSIRRSGQNRLWLTARGKGLMLLVNESKLATFPLDKNQFLASAHCAVDDEAGSLWIPTNRGLFQVSEKELLDYANVISTSPQTTPKPPFFIHHALDEGFANNEFNGSCQPCGLKLGNGYVSLPSMEGFVWFRPEQIRKYNDQSAIKLDQVLVNQIPLEQTDGGYSLPINPQNVEFHFSTPFFGNVSNLDVSYALVEKGNNQTSPNWNEIGNEMVIHYSSIHAGEYDLVVRKRSSLSADGYVYKRAHFFVPQVWYLTNWVLIIFATAISALLVVAGLMLNRFKLRAIQAENTQLETIVATRTNSLRNTMTELEASKTELTGQVHLMSRLLASITHDIQTPLNYATYVSADIVDLCKDGRYDQVQKAATIVSSISERTATLLRDLLNYVKMQMYGKQIQIKPLNIHALIQEKIALFEKVALAKNNTIINDVAEGIFVDSDEQLLAIIVHNLLDNASKYTYQGTISFSFHDDVDRKELIISNTGTGLPQEKVDFINDREVVISTDPMGPKGRVDELGLLIVKEVAAMIQVQVSVSQTDMVNFRLRFKA
ncbi:sensor histidine kinase [Dyadobacter sp. 22481]|uniref:sensor histidine kinase n=1 Tax=Dyadobacter sp. 22481 TaxID=3453926 RepID=UPI003F84ED6D